MQVFISGKGEAHSAFVSSFFLSFSGFLFRFTRFPPFSFLCFFFTPPPPALPPPPFLLFPKCSASTRHAYLLRQPGLQPHEWLLRVSLCKGSLLYRLVDCHILPMQCNAGWRQRAYGQIYG